MSYHIYKNSFSRILPTSLSLRLLLLLHIDGSGGATGCRYLRPQRTPHAGPHGAGGPPKLVGVVAGVGDRRPRGDVDRLHAPAAGQRGDLEGTEEEWSHQAIPLGESRELILVTAPQ